MAGNLEVLDASGIEVNIVPCPTIVTGAQGTERGDDEVLVVVENFEDYETDLL